MYHLGSLDTYLNVFITGLLEKLPDDQAQTLSLLLEAKQTQIENKDRLIESYESTIEILKADRQAHTKLELLLEKGRPGFKGISNRLIYISCDVS